MSDEELIAELRRHQRKYPSLIHAELCGQAADEIERLREALAEYEKLGTAEAIRLFLTGLAGQRSITQ